MNLGVNRSKFNETSQQNKKEDHISQMDSFITIMSKLVGGVLSQAYDSKSSASYIISGKIYNNVLHVYFVLNTEVTFWMVL